MPTILEDRNIACEYPTEHLVSDSTLTEAMQRAQPNSEYIALFRLARILHSVLAQNYPSSTDYDISLAAIQKQETDLFDWLTSLPSEQRLMFTNDKPSTMVTGNRAAILVSTSP